MVLVTGRLCHGPVGEQAVPGELISPAGWGYSDTPWCSTDRRNRGCALNWKMGFGQGAGVMKDGNCSKQLGLDGCDTGFNGQH